MLLALPIIPATLDSLCRWNFAHQSQEQAGRMLHDASFGSTPDFLKRERIKELLMKWHMPTQNVSCCAFHAALFEFGAVIEKVRITSKCLQFSADDAVSIECPQCFRVHAQQSHVKHNTCDYCGQVDGHPKLHETKQIHQNLGLQVGCGKPAVLRL